MANTPNYTATKEDARPWRANHDTRADAADQASDAAATALNTATTARPDNQGIELTGVFVQNGAGTQQLTATIIPLVSNPALTWVSSDPTKATVNSSGLVTRVAAGVTTITVSVTAQPNIKSSAKFTTT